MIGFTGIDDANSDAESLRWAVFWTPASVPVINRMLKAQDSLWDIATACSDSTRGQGLMIYAECISKNQADMGVFVAAQVSKIGSFDPSTFVVVRSDDPRYQILAMLPLYWYKSLE